MLALIAGQGRLPELLREHIHRQGDAYVYCVYRDSKVDDPHSDLAFRMETIGTFVKQLRSRHVTDVCLAGGIRRPKLNPLKLDFASLLLVPRFVSGLRKGDDGALRTVLGLFEENGMTVRGAHEILPSLLPEAGIPTRVKPASGDKADAERGEAIVAAMGAADVGQACVVARRQALAIEAMPGTDWMLASLKGTREGLPEGGLLFKAPKPGQDRRVDLPAIGASTIRGAAAAGLRGVVIEAGGVMVIDYDDVIDAANKAGLFLWVRPAGGVG